MITIDGAKRSNQTSLTKEQLNFMINEIGLQKQGYGFVPKYNSTLSPQQNGNLYKKSYANCWLNTPVHLLLINKFNLLIFMILSICSCSSAKGQQENSATQYDDLTQRDVYVFVEKMPYYKGSDMAFMADFNKYFQYDFSQHSEDKIQTKLRVQFVIDDKGNLTGARIYNKAMDELTGFEMAGLKTLRSMQNWQAGVHKGKTVNVILTKTIHIDMNSL